MTKEINDNSFESIIKSDKPVLIDFWAPWCGPCRQLSPIIDQISEELNEKIDVYKCNVDENPESPSKYHVRGIPSLMIFKSGKLIDSKVGSLPKNALIDWIESNI
jgi:thioredoxin 1